MQRLIIQWLAGTVVGTALIAVTSPLFVRSYVPRDIDLVRDVRTMPSGANYRWRSEGYANTQIGPHGMPGKVVIGEANPAVTRMALWGDSQAEGVCVPDDEKLFAQLERLSDGSLDVLPFARSGDDAADWVKQIPLVDRELAIDMHLILVAEVVDLLISDATTPESDDSNRLAKLPAFLIQSSRNLISDSTTGSMRRLRFSVGPVSVGPVETVRTSAAKTTTVNWRSSIRQLRESTDKPIWILYAPPSPQVAFGKVNFDDDAADQFSEIQRIASDMDLKVINVHKDLCESARAGRWPHGFHNGQIGNGHLNAAGYAVIAEAFVDQIGGR